MNYWIFYQERPGKEAICMAAVREVTLARKIEAMILASLGGRVWMRHEAAR